MPKINHSQHITAVKVGKDLYHCTVYILQQYPVVWSSAIDVYVYTINQNIATPLCVYYLFFEYWSYIISIVYTIFTTKIVWIIFIKLNYSSTYNWQWLGGFVPFPKLNTINVTCKYKHIMHETIYRIFPLLV